MCGNDWPIPSIDTYQSREIGAQLANGRKLSEDFSPQPKESLMSMLKVIEVLAESDKSWEDAAQFAVNKANDSVRNVRSIYIKNFEAQVETGKIKKYRINAKISFVLEG
jgi:flavin-binding protein dodecin